MSPHHSGWSVPLDAFTGEFRTESLATARKGAGLRKIEQAQRGGASAGRRALIEPLGRATRVPRA
jgi:hypothetical protein